MMKTPFGGVPAEVTTPPRPTMKWPPAGGPPRGVAVREGLEPFRIDHVDLNDAVGWRGCLGMDHRHGGSADGTAGEQGNRRARSGSHPFLLSRLCIFSGSS